MNELALFAGAGGGILASVLLGWHTACAVELNAYARSVLLSRQNDGTLPPFPIWDDVRTFDGKPWRGIINVVSGGFPCQDISVAGRGAGITGERSGTTQRGYDSTSEPQQTREPTRSNKQHAPVANTDGKRELQRCRDEQEQREWISNCSGWPAEPNVGRVANGVASRVDRLKSLGNGQVPRVAVAAWDILVSRIN